MKKFGRLNGYKAERGKRGETRRDGANKRSAQLAQVAIKFSGTHQNRAVSGVNLRRAASSPIKFYTDFGKIMKFHARFRHGDFGKIVKFRVEFDGDFASRRNLV